MNTTKRAKGSTTPPKGSTNNRLSKMILPNGFSLKNPFSRGTDTLKRSSRVSKKALEAQDSATSALTCNTTTHTRQSLDRFSSTSEHEAATFGCQPLDLDAVKSPGSTASPGTLKRKKLQKRRPSKASGTLESSFSEKSKDDPSARRRQRSTKKAEVSTDDSICKPRRETDSLKKRRSKNPVAEQCGGNAMTQNDPYDDSKTHDNNTGEKSKSKDKKESTKKKKKKKKKKKSALTGNVGTKTKTKRKSKRSSSAKPKRVPTETTTEENHEENFGENTYSLHSYGSFDLEESMRSELDVVTPKSQSFRSEFGSSLRREVDASLCSEYSTGRSRSAHSRSSRRSASCNHQPASLKPCLRKSPRIADPAFPELPRTNDNFSTEDDDGKTINSRRRVGKLHSQSSPRKLDEFITSHRNSFDPFEKLSDKAALDIPSGDSFCDRYTVASNGSIDLDEAFAAATSSFDGTRSTSASMDQELIGSSSTHSRSPGRLAARKKALISDWTAPVEAVDHWSSCHELRSLDMSFQSLSNSFHGTTGVTKVTKTSTHSDRSRRRGGPRKNSKSTALVDAIGHWSSCHGRRTVDMPSQGMNSSVDGDIVTEASIHSDQSRTQRSLRNCSNSTKNTGITSESDKDRSTINEENEFGEADFLEDDFDSDIEDDFDSDINDEEEHLSEENLKGGEEEHHDERSSMRFGKRSVGRAMSNTSFESISWSEKELAAFEDDIEDADHGSDAEEETLCGSVAPPPPPPPPPLNKDDDAEFPFEILQMTPRTKTKFMTKRKKLALAAVTAAMAPALT